MNQVREFLARKNISAHSFVVAIVAAFGLYVSEPIVKDIVDGFLSQHPAVGKLFAIALVIYARYSHSSPQKEATNVV